MSSQQPQQASATVAVDPARAFGSLVEEACSGAEDPSFTWVTDPGAELGLLGACRNLTAEQASERPGGRHSIAGHLHHVAFALEFGTAIFRGEKPAGDWAASWSPEQVNEAQWRAVQHRLRAAIDGAKAAMASVETWDEMRFKSGISTVAHSAYHLGVVRARLAERREG